MLISTCIHTSTEIEQNSLNRFVTDDENCWNAKETPSAAQTKATLAEVMLKTIDTLVMVQCILHPTKGLSWLA